LRGQIGSGIIIIGAQWRFDMKTDEYKKMITFAVSNEIEAYEFYKGVSEKTKDNNLKRTFAELADEEKKHRLFLEGFISNARPMHFDEAKDYKVSQTINKPKLSLSMKPADAIALAVKNEEEAMDMYTEMASCSTDAEQKKMFQSLAAMEQQHKVRLEDVFTNMAFPEVW
jgi:rubrerythrin